MRLFIAITLSDELRSSLTGTMHALKQAGVKGSYVPTQNLHLTLAFIGEVESSAPVREALGGVTFKPFRLSLDGLGSFGDILWAGAKGSQGLSAAVRAVRGALDAAGIAYDRQKFVPHITLVRRAAGRWQQIPAPRGDMMVRGIALMKSEMKDGKRVYSRVTISNAPR